MDTAELVMRLQASSVDDATLRAIDVTIDRLNSEYRFKPSGELREEAQQWLGRLSSLLDRRMNYSQHGKVLEAAARLALLVVPGVVLDAAHHWRRDLDAGMGKASDGKAA